MQKILPAFFRNSFVFLSIISKVFGYPKDSENTEKGGYQNESGIQTVDATGCEKVGSGELFAAFPDLSVLLSDGAGKWDIIW